MAGGDSGRLDRVAPSGDRAAGAAAAGAVGGRAERPRGCGRSELATGLRG